MKELKTCTKCHRELPLENFRWKDKNAGKKHSQCKECQKAQEKIHYRESLKRKENVLNTAISQKTRNKILVDSFKEKGCQKCGEKRIYLLDCHHLGDLEKTDTLARMIKSASLENVELELNKCIVLCANCHREFHHFEREKALTIQDYLWVDSSVGRALD